MSELESATNTTNKKKITDADGFSMRMRNASHLHRYWIQNK